MRVLGLMSGTSCDGVDLALTKIDSLENIKILKTNFYPYTKDLRKDLLQLINNQNGSFSEIKNIEERLSRFFLQSIQTFAHKNEYELIGIHGQTIFHRAREKEKFGQTWQLLNSDLISNVLNADVIYDFRSADIAAGGQGAPLVPFLDYFYFNDNGINQCLINIGGISNGTFLNKNQNLDEVIAYDFGPGNCLIDLAVKDLFNREYDKDGQFALEGELNKDLLDSWIKADMYFKKEAPKSTGREYYSIEYYNSLKKAWKRSNLNKYDFITTLTQFTFSAIEIELKKNHSIDEVLVTGGGAKNQYLHNCFLKANYKLKAVSEEIIDYKEAILIALLAFAYEKKINGNLPSVTGAEEKVILGKRSLSKSID